MNQEPTEQESAVGNITNGGCFLRAPSSSTRAGEVGLTGAVNRIRAKEKSTLLRIKEKEQEVMETEIQMLENQIQQYGGEMNIKDLQRGMKEKEMYILDEEAAIMKRQKMITERRKEIKALELEVTSLEKPVLELQLESLLLQERRAGLERDIQQTGTELNLLLEQRARVEAGEGGGDLWCPAPVNRAVLEVRSVLWMIAYLVIFFLLTVRLLEIVFNEA